MTKGPNTDQGLIVKGGGSYWRECGGKEKNDKMMGHNYTTMPESESKK